MSYYDWANRGTKRFAKFAGFLRLKGAMSNPELKAIAELFVTQINEQRHVLIEAGEHLATFSDGKSRDLAVRIQQVIADHVELQEAVVKLVDD